MSTRFEFFLFWSSVARGSAATMRPTASATLQTPARWGNARLLSSTPFDPNCITLESARDGRYICDSAPKTRGDMASSGLTARSEGKVIALLRLDTRAALSKWRLYCASSGVAPRSTFVALCRCPLDSSRVLYDSMWRPLTTPTWASLISSEVEMPTSHPVIS